MYLIDPNYLAEEMKSNPNLRYVEMALYVYVSFQLV